MKTTKKMTAKIAWAIAALVMAFSLLIVACSDDDDDENGTNKTGDGSAASFEAGGASNVNGKVGKVALNDGTFVDASGLTDEQKAKAVAVIFYDGNENGFLGKKTLGVGLSYSTGNGVLQWATASAEGYSTDITAIQCTPSKTDNSYDNASSAIFTGDIDGSDNWAALCAAVSDEGTGEKYPVWEWVNNYAAANSLTGDYTSGWYMPTVAELSTLYRVKDTVNTALENMSDTKIADTEYWSSSQDISSSVCAQFVVFTRGTINGVFGAKNNVKSVCAIRAF